MKPITMEFKDSSKTPLYIQLYRHIRREITCGNIAYGEKLPSLRRLSTDLSISMTTVDLAYSQLAVEGYIISKPQSGYYVADIAGDSANLGQSKEAGLDLSSFAVEGSPYKHDLSCFNFAKWKKSMARVLNDYSHLLLFESDPQGEGALRFEISKYIYTSRGVMANPDQIVIGAGTQQLTTHLCRILRKIGIGHVAAEDPGYLPVQNIFREHGFSITKVAVAEDGIRIEKLPTNIPSAVYVSPSNQFPTGSVMPIGRRYQLLEWAIENNSYILEDDYDSELRYFGKPVPALQGLDDGGHVVYLGSFSSTLFPAVKISYMVLPTAMMEIFNTIKTDYTQTCSKTEQLTLALFMEDGLYFTNIKKLRKLYGQKLQTALGAFSRFGKGFVTPTNTSSGINIILKVRTQKSPTALSEMARSIGVNVQPVASLTAQDTAALIFYYNQIPLGDMEKTIAEMIQLWRAC